MAEPLEVLVIGSGKRVREAALPALHRLADRFRVAGVFARSAKRLECDGREYAVRPLEELAPEALRAADLLYLAVTKDAVPAVLARLAAARPDSTDLLIDTPVVRFKHFRHVARLATFRRAWVAEDCSRLPWLELLRRVVDSGAIGEPRAALLLQSGYAYHALATAKSILAVRSVVAARRLSLGGPYAERRIRFAGGRHALVIEPRDYASGRLVLTGTKGSIADHPQAVAGGILLEALVEDRRCRALRAGEHELALSGAEAELTAGWRPGDSVTARMDEMKRVGLLRLFEDVAAGRGAYPLVEALDDMVVDYHLEKLGRYVANPLTSARSRLARGLLGALSRVSG